MNAMVCFGESNLAMSPTTAHQRLVVSTPNPGMERSREARGSRLVASVRSFITESFLVGIDLLMQNLLVEGACTDAKSPCMERRLDVHHSLRSLPLQLAIGGLQGEQTAFLTRLPSNRRQPAIIGQIHDRERVIEVGLLAIAMILHPRLDMPPVDHKDFMSQGLYLLANLIGAVARLHGDQCWSHVGQKRI